MSVVKSELRYSKDHEWVDGEGTVKVGITDFAQDALGEVVFADLPEVGDEVTHSEECGELESTKSVSELFSPVSGIVKEINDEVVDNPELVNSDPYGAGWLFSVEVSEEGPLMSAEEYTKEFDIDAE